MNIVASVQARLGSTRLPGKVLFHLNDRRLLQWAIDRTETAETVDKTVAAIGNRAENEAIEAYCERAEIKFLVGPEDDLLARHRTVAEQTDCDLLVRITADCPFVPANEINRIVEEHLANNARYTTNVTDEMPVGTAVDVIDSKVFEELHDLGETHPVRRLRNNPEEWNVVVSPDKQWIPFSDAHIAVDTPDDYWRLSDAVEAVGDQPRAVAEWVAER